MQILIVGQNPSKKNTDPSVPFKGTKSYDTLNTWANVLNIMGRYDLINCNDYVDTKWNTATIDNAAAAIQYVCYANRNYNKVLALGEIASKVLAKAGVMHYKLPHPSGRNRKLNNKQWLDRELNKCREYLNE